MERQRSARVSRSSPRRRDRRDAYLLSVDVLVDHGLDAILGEGERGHESGLRGLERHGGIGRELLLLRLGALRERGEGRARDERAGAGLRGARQQACAGKQEAHHGGQRAQHVWRMGSSGVREMRCSLGTAMMTWRSVR